VLGRKVGGTMRDLPVPDPGTPDHRSATRYLWWLTRLQWRTVTLGVTMGIIWMVSQALMPATIGTAIEQGVTQRDTKALALWAGALLGLGVLQAVAGVMRHRCAVFNWLSAAYRTVQVTVRQAGRLGATLPKRMATGEVLSVGTNDVAHIGNAIDVTARGAGSVVAIVTVAVILLRASLPLGLVVVLGVPVLLTIVGILIRPLHHRQQAYRSQTAALTTRAADIVTGLRVLRGIGGEAAFAQRYRAESQRVRAAGVRVARVESLLEALQILLPGLFVAMVTWLGARFAVAGEISVGQLIAFYGYAVFLLFPLRTLTEVADKITRGHVAARRVVAILSLDPELTDPPVPGQAPDPLAANLVDPLSGVIIRPRRLTAIAAARPEDAVTVADRLGRYVDGPSRLDGVPLAELDRATVRWLILVADNDARLLSGRLRDELTQGRTIEWERVREALHAASAEDIVEALPDGLDAMVAERGREFSGGQQQRLRLTRALLADPPVLILVEPTSAVDAHTEARIAVRLADARPGRTTVVCTTSPLVLDQADHVIYLEAGRVAAEGTHRELLASSRAYAATVTRGEDESALAVTR
jgi:ABC-type multidrug transport system fused ATPase/permease subunit